MLVMHGEDMHVMFVRIEQVDPMFAVLVLWTNLPKENSKRLCGGIKARNLCLY